MAFIVSHPYSRKIRFARNETNLSVAFSFIFCSSHTSVWSIRSWNFQIFSFFRMAPQGRFQATHQLAAISCTCNCSKSERVSGQWVVIECHGYLRIHLLSDKVGRNRQCGSGRRPQRGVGRGRGRRWSGGVRMGRSSCPQIILFSSFFLRILLVNNKIIKSVLSIVHGLKTRASYE